MKTFNLFCSAMVGVGLGQALFGVIDHHIHRALIGLIIAMIALFLRVLAADHCRG